MMVSSRRACSTDRSMQGIFWPGSFGSRWRTCIRGTSSNRAVRQAIRAAGIRLFFLPPCSPDPKPIEGRSHCCAKQTSGPSSRSKNASRSCSLGSAGRNAATTFRGGVCVNLKQSRSIADRRPKSWAYAQYYSPKRRDYKNNYVLSRGNPTILLIIILLHLLFIK